MAIQFNEFQKKLAKAMGITPDSENDLRQINEFAALQGIKNVNSQNDLNQLLPAWDALRAQNTIKDAAAKAPPSVTNPAPLPPAAADGTSSAFDFQALLMQQQASLAAQNQAFQLAQQQFAQQQALQQAEMMKQLQAAQVAAAPTPPAAQTSGWKPASGAKTTLESLLLGTEAVTGAMKAVVA